MSFNVKQFRSLIERVLAAIDSDLNSPAAVELLLGTAAQESQLGTYLRQINGPAIGVFQVEPATFEWLQAKYEHKYPMLKGRSAGDMETDLRLAILVARLRYRAVVFPLPAPDDLDGMAAYWKRNYNSPLGAGTVDEFKENYKRFVA